MSVTSGFFNSLNGDRRYNAEQMSAIFDGIINDGVLANVGKAFMVKASTGNNVTVEIGRAWFNSTWIYNDAIISLTADQSELILDRYDAVIIEVDHSDAVRSGSIKIIKGTPASNPNYPTLTRNRLVNQYPLAYILRKAGTTSITQDKIRNMVGTSSCPYVTGILQVQNIDNIVAQWEAQWLKWSSQWSQWGAEWDEWFNKETSEAESAVSKWTTEMKADFDRWFGDLQIILEGDVATALANRVLELQDRFYLLAKDKIVIEDLRDSNGEYILDSYGKHIQCVSVIASKESSDNTPTTGSDKCASQMVNTTLFASKWSDELKEFYEDAPYKYILSMNRVTNTSNQEILPPATPTVAQLEAIQAANIQDGGQSLGEMTLLAYGDKPEIDIPIRVILRGDI